MPTAVIEMEKKLLNLKSRCLLKHSLGSNSFFFFFHREREKIVMVFPSVTTRPLQPSCTVQPRSSAAECRYLCTDSWQQTKEMISLCYLHLKPITAVIRILEFTWCSLEALWGVNSQNNFAGLKWSWRQLLWDRCGYIYIFNGIKLVKLLVLLLNF